MYELFFTQSKYKFLDAQVDVLCFCSIFNLFDTDTFNMYFAELEYKCRMAC